MGVFGTSEEEERALRAAGAAVPRGTNFDSRSSLDVSNSSAYETASEFASDIDANSVHSANDAESTSTIRQQNEDAAAAHNEKTVPLVPVGAVAPLQADAAPQATTHIFRVDSHRLRLEPSRSDELYDDENEVRSVFNEPGFDSSRMSENQLNRIASQNTEHSMSISVARSITRGEPVHIKDLEYDGPDDKANPYNWPAWKKWVVTFTIANTCLCISLGSSLYVEGVPELMVAFGMSETLALSGLSLYLLGLALGPVIGAPLSEMYGRRIIYVISFPCAILFTMGVGLSQNAWSVLILRFLTGLIASPPMSIAGGSITDIWANQPEKMSTAMALFCLSPFLGPVIGPIIGGFAAESKGWRWTLWITMMFYGAVLPFLLWAPETYKSAILRRRAKKRGIKVIEQKYTFKELVQINLFRPLEMLFVEPIVGLSSIYTGFVFAVLFGFFEAFPIIFRGEYLMATGVSGLTFIGVGVGLCLAVLLFIVVDKLYFFPLNPDGTRGKRDEEGKLIWDAPETRLLIVEIGAFLLPISLFWLAWTSRKSIHWIVPVLSAVPFGFGLLWVFFGIVLYYSMSFPPAYVASALAANNLIRYITAGAFPLFTVQMYDRLGIDWATSLFAFIALAMVPIPFAFHKYGEKLRLKSKYGYVAMFKKIAAQKAAAAQAAAAQQQEAPEEKVSAPAESSANQSDYSSSRDDSQDIAQKV